MKDLISKVNKNLCVQILFYSHLKRNFITRAYNRSNPEYDTRHYSRNLLQREIKKFVLHNFKFTTAIFKHFSAKLDSNSLVFQSKIQFKFLRMLNTSIDTK